MKSAEKRLESLEQLRSCVVAVQILTKETWQEVLKASNDHKSVRKQLCHPQEQKNSRSWGEKIDVTLFLTAIKIMGWAVK